MTTGEDLVRSLFPAGSDELCGRPTKKDGTPCKRERMRPPSRWAVPDYESPACSAHATREECAENERVHVLEEERWIAYHQSCPVECWSWPITDEHRQRADEANACEDAGTAYDLAWVLLAEWQQDRCAVCGGYSEVLDHDHATGLVRGWLCRNCNTQEGFAAIPGGRFERYRVKNPVSILGLTLRYYSPILGWATPKPELSMEEQMDRAPGWALAAYLSAG